VLIPETAEGFGRSLIWVLVVAGLLFIGLRVVGLMNAPEFEDHDSIAYLRYAAVVQSGDLQEIINLTPDAAPVYPVAVAALAAPLGDLEVSARAVSLLASCLVALWVVVLAVRLAAPWGAAVALLLLALNPTLLRLSYSVLSEPIYVAIALGAFTVYCSRFERPTAKSGALVGLLAGLAFLTRFEGILFLLAIPALQLAHRLLFPASYSWRALGRFVAAHVVAFMAVALPQVARVSYVMGEFALNGRTVWSALLRAPDGKSYSEKIYGLDFDPAVTNIEFLTTNAAAASTLVANSGLWSMAGSYTKLLLVNIRELNDMVLGSFVGLPVLVFAVIGLTLLARREQVARTCMLVAFVAIGLIGPLLHSVHARHIAVIVPVLILFAGVGVAESVRAAMRVLPMQKPSPIAIGILMTAFASSAYALDLGRVLLRADNANPAYDRESLAEAARLIQSEAAADQPRPVVVARMSYFGHFAGAVTKIAPYTDLDGLIFFCGENEVDYLFVEARQLQRYPFKAQLGSDRARRQFQLIHTGEDSTGEALELYRFLDQPPSSKREARDD